MQMIYTPNDYSTISDVPFLIKSCMQPKIGELWFRTYIIASSIWHFVCTYKHNLKRLLYV